MESCIFCQRSCKNKNSKINHERFCNSNPSRIDSPFKKYKETNRSPWNKGLVKEENESLMNMSQTLKAKFECGSLVPSKIRDIEAFKQKRKTEMLERYANGWEPVCGRSKKYKYNGISVDGTWELKFCEFIDKTGVTWQRNKKRFQYVNLKGTVSTYQPDFYIEDFDCFIEIKGYETPLDRCKWSQFQGKLIVVRKDDIFDLDKWYLKFKETCQRGNGCDC